MPTHYRTRLLLVVLVCGVVAARLWVLDYARSQNTLVPEVGRVVTLQGTVADDPDVRATSLHLTIAATSLDGRPAQGNLLVFVDRTFTTHYGDTVEVRGRLESPQAFITDTGHEFDYPGYLAVRGIEVMMPKAQVKNVATAAPSLQGTLFDVKHAFEEKLERQLPEPQASLLEGILLGERRGVPKDVTQEFAISSLIHVVVLSGYNISLVSEAVFRVLAFLPRTLSMLGGWATIVLFALMTGGGATTVRACIMASVALLARYYHRPVVAMRALAAAVALMVLWNPLVLLYDPSFILSVLATFGLITLSPMVEMGLARYPLLRRKQMLGVRSIAASTIAVQIYILPALLYFTGILSFVALPANVLALPVVPATMFFGFVSGLLGFLHPLAGLLPSIVTDLLLRWILWVAHVGASLPGAFVTVAQFPAWVAIVAYVPLTWWASAKYRQSVSQEPANSHF